MEPDKTPGRHSNSNTASNGTDNSPTDSNPTDKNRGENANRPEHTVADSEIGIAQNGTDGADHASDDPANPSSSGLLDGTSSLPADPAPNSEATLYDQPWLNSVFRPALTAIMGAALAIAMLGFMRRFAPDMPAAYIQVLVAISLLASLVACYSTTWLAQPAQRARRNIGFRAAEFGLLFALTRLGVWIALGSWPTFNLFIMRPVDALLDGSFIAALIVVAIAWLMAAAFTSDQLALALQPDDLYMAQTFTDRWQDTSRPLYTDRPAIMRRFVGRWVLGGVLLVLLAAGAQFDAPQFGILGIARQSIDPAVIGAIVVYFLCGLILVSQGQLALLRSRWTLHKTPAAEGIMRNWTAYAVGLILIVGLVALLLPLGGTFWAAVIIGTALQTIYFVVMSIFQGIMGILLFLLSLLSGEETSEEPPAEEARPEPAMPEEMPPALFELPDWTGGVVFWVIIALILGYATYIYFSDRGIQFGWLRRFFAALRARWNELFGAYQTWQATRLRDRRAAEALEDEKRGLGLPSWLRLRNLSPSQRVHYYYLSTLHRAAEAGLPRRPAETPLRYAPRLARFIEENNLEHPDEEADVEELTTAFLRVRYAEKEVSEEELSFLQRVWERLRRYLKL